MKTKYTIRTIVAQIGDGLRLGVGSGLFLCLLLSPLVHGQGAQRQWGGETLTSLGGAEYQSPKFGRVSMTGNPATSNLGWVPSLGSFLEAKANGGWNSPEYGEVERGNANAGWAVSSRFGWTHFAPNAETYGGWTWTERFQWMKFERPGNAVYLWVPMMNSWMSVNGDGSFTNFQWGHLTSQGLNRYQSSIFGGLTTGDFGGWVASDRFGWMWANGDGVWFWSEGWREWLGVTEDGGIWSTKDQRFLGTYDEMEQIPAGWFTMGGGHVYHHVERTTAPATRVYVSTFFIGRYEVTYEQWMNVSDWAKNNGYTDQNSVMKTRPTHPVHSVSWWQALKWCNARSEMEGLNPVYRNSDGSVFRTGMTLPIPDWTANGYRLPTEAEWEKAARGGVGAENQLGTGRVTFPWGDTISHEQANYKSEELDTELDVSSTPGYHPDFISSYVPYTSPVGSFEPNGYGLYDVAGNVREWCWDFANNHPYIEGEIDPKGGNYTSGFHSRILRGGSWQQNALFSRSKNRDSMIPAGGGNTVGFRVVRRSLY